MNLWTFDNIIIALVESEIVKIYHYNNFYVDIPNSFSPRTALMLKNMIAFLKERKDNLIINYKNIFKSGLSRNVLTFLNINDYMTDNELNNMTIKKLKLYATNR